MLVENLLNASIVKRKESNYDLNKKDRRFSSSGLRKQVHRKEELKSKDA